MATLTDIRRSGPGFRRRTLVIDGDPWREIPAGVAAALELEVSDEVDRDELAIAIGAAEIPRAREKALRLLTARERSTESLRTRLVDEGFSSEVATETVAYYERIGLVDDERFAHSLVRTLANARGKGRSGIAHELKSAGIDEQLANEALDEELGVADELQAAHRLAAAAAARTGATVDKITAKLVRKGYRLPLALTAARGALEARDAARGAAADAFDDASSAAQDPFDD
jgi:regulatory protein